MFINYKNSTLNYYLNIKLKLIIKPVNIKIKVKNSI